MELKILLLVVSVNKEPACKRILGLHTRSSVNLEDKVGWWGGGGKNIDSEGRSTTLFWILVTRIPTLRVPVRNLDRHGRNLVTNGLLSASPLDFTVLWRAVSIFSICGFTELDGG